MRCRGKVFLTLMLVVISVLLRTSWICSLEAAEKLREDTAQLDFIKTDIIRPFKDQQVACENYIVKEGDYVWKILRKRGHGPASQLLHWSKVLQTLNPHVEDVDRIYSGQRLLIPLGFVKEMEDEPAERADVSDTKTYQVKPGDTLTRILRHQSRVPEDVLFKEALDRVQKLNPEIKDVNRIQAGQRLLIPIYKVGDIEEETSPPAAAKSVPPAPPTPEWALAHDAESEETEKPAEESTPGPTEIVVDMREPEYDAIGAPVQERGADTPLKTRLAPQVSPDEQRIQVLADAFMALAVALGGRSQNSGRHFLPLKGEGQIALNARSFPLLEFPTGEHIFLDLHDRLTRELEEAIRANWENRYAVVNISEADNFRTVWQRVMEHLNQMEQWLDRDPLIIREPVDISVRGDWVLSLSTSDLQQRRIFVINLLTDGRERTDLAAQAYLDSLGVRVVDVQLRGQLERARIIAPLDERAFLSKDSPTVARPSSALEAAMAFLDLLEQPYEREARIPLYADEDKEVTVTVRAGLYFQRAGSSHLVDFRLLSPEVLHLLEQRQQRVLIIDPSWSTIRVFEAMAEHLGLALENPSGFFVSERDPIRNIQLKLPGDVFKDGDRTYLLTPMTLPGSLLDFLSRRSVRVLSFG